MNNFLTTLTEFLNTHFSLLEQILVGGIILCFIYELYHYLRYIRAPKRARKKSIPSTTDLPPVSVIVCAKNEENNLHDYLHSLLTQDYPIYEVIVINDGSCDNTDMVLKCYQQFNDKRLKLSFVPQSAQMTSTKKLAITLGVKASQYDYLLLTDADCRPRTNHWIQAMMQAFTPKTDIVLGYSPMFHREGGLNRLIEYDTLYNGLLYLGKGQCGKAYMGVGRNLAYRKSAFIEGEGFKMIMRNKSGDDDLLVQHLARRKNVRIAVSEDALVWTPAKRTWREWVQQKRRHLSVAPRYNVLSKWRVGIEPIIRFLFYSLIILGCTITSNLYVIGTVLLLFLIRWLVQWRIITSSSKLLRGRRFGLFTVLYYDILLPILSSILLMTNGRYKRATTW